MYAWILDSAIDRRDNLHVVIGMASSSLEAFCSRCNQPTLCLVSHLFYTTVIFIRGANSLVTIITMILFSLFLRILAHGGSSATRSHRKATLAKKLATFTLEQIISLILSCFDCRRCYDLIEEKNRKKNFYDTNYVLSCTY